MWSLHLYADTFFVQRTMSEIQIDCLTRNLGEADLSYNMKLNDCSIYSVDKSTPSGDESVNTKESEAILVVKQLQEKVFIILSISYFSGFFSSFLLNLCYP